MEKGTDLFWGGRGSSINKSVPFFLMAEAMGGDFRSGAIAAGANEALVAFLGDKLLPKDVDKNSPEYIQGMQNLLAASQIVGVLASVVADGDVNIGAAVAANATQHNFLNHQDVDDLKEEAKKCHQTGSCDEFERLARAKSLANHERLLNCQALGNCSEFRSEIDAGSAAVDGMVSQLGNGKGSDILGSYTAPGGDNPRDWTLAGQLHIGRTAEMLVNGKPGALVELGRYLDQSGFNPVGVSAAGLGGLAGTKTSSSGATKGAEPAKAGTTAGETTPKWDNAVSRADGDFGPVSHPVIPKTTGNYPEGINFNPNIKNHLSGVDGFTQKKGVLGGHNIENFSQVVAEKGIKVVGQSPGAVDGIATVKYQIPAYDRSGSVAGYRSQEFTKTVYDPKVISDQRILDLGQQAAASGYKEAMAKGIRAYDGVAGGVKFRIYLDVDTGRVRDFHPK